ncbi:MAG: hydroxymyristoyl-ACP dehydratase [Flavobacteriaceae bacterium]|nr:hydroxymyristoyl-ACP dehydratase [Flavobacteriaceae bacterium]
MEKYQSILNQLPYEAPFLFVDEIHELSEEHVIGSYKFKHDEYFYQGHFKNHPVTPGVILTECMAQIGLACLGLFLVSDNEISADHYPIALSESNITFLKAVMPGDTVRVTSEKVYFRFGKLKCKVRMTDAEDELVCHGILSGMIIPSET